eukprot:gene2597-5511_t
MITASALPRPSTTSLIQSRHRNEDTKRDHSTLITFQERRCIEQ